MTFEILDTHNHVIRRGTLGRFIFEQETNEEKKREVD
jgi:hypothetical protein